jgi:DNA-binding response OmpR family regulator
VSDARFLLINGAEGIHWEKALESALSSLGPLEAASRDEAPGLIERNEYALVFIDATTVTDVVETVCDLRGRWKSLPIIVAAASTEWAPARATFRAGATDYVIKSYDRQELLSIAHAIMDQSMRSDR